MAEFILAKKEWVADFIIEAEAYSGVKKILDKVRQDVYEVTGQLPKVEDDLKEKQAYAVIVGTYGKSKRIQRFEQEGRLDLSHVKGKREVYHIEILKQPCEEIDEALVICGSDKRGTIYGLFQLSEWMGVSPWIDWADVKPTQKEEVIFHLEEPYTSKEPSVKYRGFFINDEWPSFGAWTFEHFGGFTAQMYDKVFELLLRLKGNYLWPAMWSSSFSLDGPGLKSAELADEYGVIMGQSHHEPCLRASEEWDIYKGEETPYGTEWNYYTNKEGLIQYWKDGLKRSGQYESVITIGMRGERDSSMLGDYSSLEENIELLKDIITEQRKLIKEEVNQDLDQVPQMLALYKEVEDYFYGDKETVGLKDWDGLEGVTLMLCEDNFGNMRTLPEAAQKNRKGGWGMYYHFDYHGAPISYEWVNSTPLSKVWEQMSMAYDYGVNELWIVNVGDLKPQELPLSYFMALAYDFEKWGTCAINQTHTFTKDWVKQQFNDGLTQEEQEDIVEILEGYTRLNGRCRPEVVSSKTYHSIRYHEAERILDQIEDLSEKANALLQKVSNRLYDAYYELVYFPAMASFNLNKMQIYAGMNQEAAAGGKMIANTYADYVTKCIEKDAALKEVYHSLADGKWRGMASSAHIGFTHWNDEDWRYPIRQMVEPVLKARMIVSIEGLEQSYTSGVVEISKEVSEKEKTIEVKIDNGGKPAFVYEINTDAKWIHIDAPRGKVGLQQQVLLTLDTMLLNSMLLDSMRSDSMALNEKQSATVTIKGTGTEVRLILHVENKKMPTIPMTFVEGEGYIAIEAEHFAECRATNESKWCVIEDYGRTLSGVKVFPTDVTYTLEEEAPSLVYRIAVKEAGAYTLEVHCAPSNPLKQNGRLRYALKVNENSWQAIDLVKEDFKGGSWYDSDWCQQVLENINRSFTKLQLNAGINTITIKAMDAGVVIERLLIAQEDVAVTSAYLGPEESEFVR